MGDVSPTHGLVRLSSPVDLCQDRTRIAPNHHAIWAFYERIFDYGAPARSIGG